LADPQPASGQKLPFELQNNEVIRLVARKHIAYFVWQVTKHALAGLIPAAALLAIFALTAGLDGTLGLVVWAIAAAWLVFWAIKIYFDWYSYRNDIWVVTNQRVIDSYKRNWFAHRMASTDLVSVEDMSIDKSGVIPTAFNFGHLQLQTAGQRENFILSGIPKPSNVLALIDSERDAARRELRGLA